MRRRFDCSGTFQKALTWHEKTLNRDVRAMVMFSARWDENHKKVVYNHDRAMGEDAPDDIIWIDLEEYDIYLDDVLEVTFPVFADTDDFIPRELWDTLDPFDDEAACDDMRRFAADEINGANR